jgi:Cdc25 family phosphatase
MGSTTDETPTIASLERISREQLSSELLNASDSSNSPSTPPSNIAIIDVRDSDHVGGHIKGSTWVPLSELDFKLPELVRQLGDKEVVVFHCALSQQRGPSAALRYLREKRRLGPDAVRKEAESEGKGEEEVKSREDEAKGKEQKVVVLEGGFTKWQEKYGEDKRLTEAYQKDIWEFGY